jgi:molybdate transport system substrate-binding protein
MAIGQTRAVPVGIYGRAALETLDLWTTLSPHLAETDNTRAAPDLHIVATIPATALPEIRYPVAAVLEGDQPTAQSFITALTTPTAAAIFKAAGFITIDAPDD